MIKINNIKEVNNKIIPKIGFEFNHSRWLTPDHKHPLRYVVTRIANGVVYYKPVSGGNSECIEIEKFDKVVKKEE